MAKDIFDKTIFDGYRVESLTESAQDIIPKYNFDGSTKTTVFISHKHDDLDEIKGLIGLLERKYNIKAYIDSLDKSMPKKTSGETASKIKQRINRCNKFILLATNGAVESKWCNWELGYGDAQKFDTDNIALFPIKPDKTNDYDYKGNEYMRIYPHIAYYYGSERYSNGTVIKEGFYVCTDKKQDDNIVEANGVKTEFDIAIDAKHIVIPVGCTGYMAQKLWEQINLNIEEYYGKVNNEVRKTFRSLNTKMSNDEIVSNIVKLIKLLRR